MNYETGMPVSLVVCSFADNMSFRELQLEYSVSLEDIHAVLNFAGRLIEREEVHALPVRSLWSHYLTGIRKCLINSDHPSEG